MRIKLYATLRNAADGKLIELETPPAATVRDVLSTVAAQKPKLGAEIFDAHGNLRDIIRVLLNGRQIEYLPDGIETRLSNTDELDLFPPVGGGM
jgi:MoaD family protein